MPHVSRPQPLQRPVEDGDGMVQSALRDAVTAWHRQHTQLPHPGQGDTLARWRALAGIAADDLCVVKVLEAHYDAIAILADLDGAAPASGSLLAVWAAEPPDARVAFIADGDPHDGVLVGTKAWCSGADLVDEALVTAHQGDERVLVRVDLARDGVRRDDAAWQAVGMSRVRSGRVTFDHVPAQRVGAAGAYLERPGFWHGGAGIAACWFGAATAIADRLRTDARAARSPHAQAHLGAIEMALAATASLLRETAAMIDAAPTLSHERAVTRARSVAERAATEVIDRVGRALGPAPLCTDAAHARRCADLAVFIRQSHAESDWAALGAAVHAEDRAWTL